LDYLERTTGWVKPGIEPGIHPQADQVEKEISRHACNCQSKKTKKKDALFSRGDEEDDCIEEDKDRGCSQVSLNE
jgi:hypothetical protein